MEIKSIDELFTQDIKGNKTGSFIKSKGFLILAGVVALVALYAFIKSRRKPAEESETQAVYAATYPTGGGGGGGGGGSAGTDTDIVGTVSSMLSEQAEELNKVLSAQNDAMAQSMAAQDTTFNALSTDLFALSQTVAENKAAAEKESRKVISYVQQGETVNVNRDDEVQDNLSVVQQMAANSLAFQATGNMAERKTLMEANKSLGASIGATTEGGKWYAADGSRLYFTSADYDKGTETFGK